MNESKQSHNYTMSTTNFQIKDSSSVSASNTNLLNSSGMALSYFPNPEQIKNERESLSRIHTFSLKEQADEDLEAGQPADGAGPNPPQSNNILGDGSANATSSGGGPETSKSRGAGHSRGGRGGGNLSMDQGRPASGTRARGLSEGSRTSSVASNRSCSQYVPEKVQIFDKQMK